MTKTDKNKLEMLAKLFQALTDPKRIELLKYISEQPAGESTYSTLREEFNMTQPNASYHLKLLQNSRLVTSHKIGRNKVVCINEKYINQYLPDFLKNI